MRGRTNGSAVPDDQQPDARPTIQRDRYRGADGLRAAGCSLYAVSLAADDEVTIWVSEIWESKSHHDASLQLPETRAAIAKAMPMLTGEFTGQELNVVGGLGVGP